MCVCVCVCVCMSACVCVGEGDTEGERIVLISYTNIHFLCLPYSIIFNTDIIHNYLLVNSSDNFINELTH